MNNSPINTKTIFTFLMVLEDQFKYFLLQTNVVKPIALLSFLGGPKSSLRRHQSSQQFKLLRVRLWIAYQHAM